jgi:hypothetical protein
MRQLPTIYAAICRRQTHITDECTAFVDSAVDQRYRILPCVGPDNIIAGIFQRPLEEVIDGLFVFNQANPDCLGKGDGRTAGVAHSQSPGGHYVAAECYKITLYVRIAILQKWAPAKARSSSPPPAPRDIGKTKAVIKQES